MADIDQAAGAGGGLDASLTTDDLLDQELAGLDLLEMALPSPPSAGKRVWDALWPKVTAIVLALAGWQIVVWTGWKPRYVLPGPGQVFAALFDDRAPVASGALTTLRHAITFYLLALAIGTVLAVVITRWKVLRTAVSPLITGLQTMPSVAWVPFAILIFGLSTKAILFVTVLGTAPAITIGATSGIDAVPPGLLRAGHLLGARGINRYRYIVLPAALPGYVAGMKQGWAFAWRSLMAAELIAIVHGSSSLGQLLSNYQDQSQSADMMATMVVILVIGLIMDTLVFSRLERVVLDRRGLGAGQAGGAKNSRALLSGSRKERPEP